MPRLLTWRLWRALQFPDDAHPLFRRVQAQKLPGQRWYDRLAAIYGKITALVTVVLVLVSPLALLIVSNLLGMLVALTITYTINRERQQGTYDLLALTPSGGGSANWQIAAACAYRLNTIELLASLRTFSVTTLFLLFVYSVGSERLTPIPVIALLLALNLDAIQSQIVGCLSGMLGQLYGAGSAVIASLAIFAGAQVIAVYLPAAALGLLTLEALRPFQLEAWLSQGIAAIVALLVLFGGREVLIRLMWRELERRLV